MSIVLKTDPKQLASAPTMFGGKIAELSPLYHDALAAHAMQMAIEEFESSAGKDHIISDFDNCREIADWINERAAANLARLMGEGNGNG